MIPDDGNGAAEQWAENQTYEEVEGYFPLVIEKSEFYKAQAALEKNKEIYATRGPPPKGFNNFLQRLAENTQSRKNKSAEPIRSADLKL
jgi:hypothetical protein